MLQMQLRFVLKAPVPGHCRSDQTAFITHTGVLYPYIAGIWVNTADKESTGSLPAVPDVAKGTVRVTCTGKRLDS